MADILNVFVTTPEWDHLGVVANRPIRYDQQWLREREHEFRAALHEGIRRAEAGYRTGIPQTPVVVVYPGRYNTMSKKKLEDAIRYIHGKLPHRAVLKYRFKYTPSPEDADWHYDDAPDSQIFEFV